MADGAALFGEPDAKETASTDEGRCGAGTGLLASAFTLKSSSLEALLDMSRAVVHGAEGGRITLSSDCLLVTGIVVAADISTPACDVGNTEGLVIGQFVGVYGGEMI